MSNEELFQKAEYLLQRKLTPDECKFLMLASEVLQKQEPEREPVKLKSRVA